MVSADLITTIAGGARSLAEPLAIAMNQWWPVYEINTVDRQAIFLAQACHETAGFKTLEEYGGPAYFARYDGRADLGNVEPGDGARYHGRGIFQLTGRANYRGAGTRLKLDLEADPELAADPDTSVLIACDYWKTRGLEIHADRRDFMTVTRRINGGLTGWDDRFRYWARAWRALAQGA
jgi:putative chitinase